MIYHFMDMVIKSTLETKGKFKMKNYWMENQ